MSTTVVAFLLSGLAVVVAGTFLARYGDAIGDRTRIGGMWVGMVLLAGATSLPELATGITAVRMGAFDLAAGNLFGSSMANMLLLGVLDLVRRREVFRQASLAHVAPACLAIVLNAFAAACVLFEPGAIVFGASWGSLALVAFYLVGTRALYLSAREGPVPDDAGEPGVAAAPSQSGPSLQRAVIGFLLASGGIFVAAPVFARSAEEVARATGLGSTFVGTLLVGFATSLPELAVSFAAVRMGAVNLAVGNLFGSNTFNMMMFPIYDLAAAKSLFSVVAKEHALTGIFAVVLTAVALSGVVSRPATRPSLLRPGSAGVVFAYIVFMAILYFKVHG